MNFSLFLIFLVFEYSEKEIIKEKSFDLWWNMIFKISNDGQNIEKQYTLREKMNGFRAKRNPFKVSD